MIRRWFGGLRHPPFANMAVTVWFFYLFCTVILPHGPIWRGQFPDSDDYAYLAQTLDWLRGQGWYDITEYRLDPPRGTPLHFFHLPEVPLAAIILPLHWFGVNWVTAATIAAGIWPLVLLAGLLAVLQWIVADFLPREWAGLTALMLLFMSPLLVDYMPGRVHHHGVVMLIVMLAFGCAVRVMKTPRQLKWGVWTGCLLALAMGIGLETLPFVAFVSGWLLLWMMAKGRAATASGLVFGTSLFLASALMVALLLPPSRWFTYNMVAYSVVYVYFVGGIACAFAGTALAAQTRFAWLRYAAGAGLAAASARLFFLAFPDLLGGPWGAVDKMVKEILVDNVAEATPLIDFSGASRLAIIEFGFVPVIAFIGTLFLWRRSSVETVWAWGLQVLLLGAAIGLSLFYQVRYVPYAQLLSVIPLAVLCQRGLPRLAQTWRGWRFKTVKCALVTLLVLDLLMAPMQFQFGFWRIDLHPLAALLNDPHLYGDRRRVIINTINDGAELLFRTDHAVLAAPYHTNTVGNIDAFKFFLTTDPDQAQIIARAHHVDLVIMNYATMGNFDDMIAMEDGSRMSKPLNKSTFTHQLAFGRVPRWLKPVDLPLPDGFMMFEVKKE